MNDDLSEVVRMLTDVVGEDFLHDVEIGPDTVFGGALALESIEFAALAARVREHGADLPGLIAGLDLDQLLNLTVGDVAGHITATRAATTGAAR